MQRFPSPKISNKIFQRVTQCLQKVHENFMKDAINTGKSQENQNTEKSKHRELLLQKKIVFRNIEDNPNFSTREIARKSPCFYMGNIKGNWIMVLLSLIESAVNSDGLFTKINISFTKKIWRKYNIY